MATAIKQPVSVAYTLHGGPPITVVLPEAASQTFVKGEAVYLDGSGNVAEYTTAIDDASQRFLGFAAADGQNNSTAAAVSSTVILPWGVIFEGTVCTGAYLDQVTAKTQVGTAYVMAENATLNIVQIDIGNTGGNISAVRIVGISPKGAVGDTNGRVLFVVIPAATQITGAA
jgi:hypothetical protein